MNLFMDVEWVFNLNAINVFFKMYDSRLGCKRSRIQFPDGPEIFLTGRVGRVFANGPGDLGSIPGCVIPKTLKMVLDTSLLNTQ